MSWLRNCPNCIAMWDNFSLCPLPGSFSHLLHSSPHLCILVDTSRGLMSTCKISDLTICSCLNFYLAWPMFENIIFVICCRCHSPQFDGRSSPVGRCLVPQVVALPVQSTLLDETSAIHYLAFAHLDSLLLQLELSFYFCVHQSTCLIKCSGFMSYVLFN